MQSQFRGKKTITKRVKKVSGAPLSEKQKIQVKRLVGNQEEKKYQDTTSPSNSISASATLIGPVTLVSQGSTASNRSGDEMYIKKIMNHEQMIVGDATNFVRVIWFQWFANSASITPTIGAILQNPGVPTNSAINDTNSGGKLFKVISDKCYSLVSAGPGSCLSVKSEFYGKNIPRKTVEFNPSATSAFNHIYVFVVSDSIAAPNPSYTLYSRCEFTDA